MIALLQSFETHLRTPQHALYGCQKQHQWIIFGSGFKDLQLSVGKCDLNTTYLYHY